jgi:hypothetical protein
LIIPLFSRGGLDLEEKSSLFLNYSSCYDSIMIYLYSEKRTSLVSNSTPLKLFLKAFSAKTLLTKESEEVRFFKCTTKRVDA